MKQKNCTVSNIKDDILGIVTFKKHRFFHRRKYIYVTKEENKPCNGFLATLSTKLYSEGMGVYGSMSNIDDFNEGDILLLNKQGEIFFLYEINSEHNVIFATERCNHRCVMCPQPPISIENDRTDFNLRLISFFDKGTKEVGITGGEPTLIGDNLFKLINQVKKSCPKAAISLLSNGVNFSDISYAEKLAACNHFDLQIDVPIFSDIADEHNKIVGAKTFYKTVQGLYNLASLRQKIGLRIVIHKLTYKRLPQLADYIYHNFPFVTQVAFLQMETTGLAEKNLQDLWIDPYDYTKELQEAVLLLSNRGFKVYIYNAQLCVLPNSLRTFAKQSISDWKKVYLSQCDGCILRSVCAGLFSTNNKHISTHISCVK